MNQPDISDFYFLNAKFYILQVKMQKNNFFKADLYFRTIVLPM